MIHVYGLLGSQPVLLALARDEFHYLTLRFQFETAGYTGIHMSYHNHTFVPPARRV